MSDQLTLSQTAQLLKTSEKSIRRYIKAGRIKGTLIKGERGYEYRIRKNQLKSFIKPPRGKNSHQRANKKPSNQGNNSFDKLRTGRTKKQKSNSFDKLRTGKARKQENKKAIPSTSSGQKKQGNKKAKPNKNNQPSPIAPPIDSLSNILEQKIKNSPGYLGTEDNINYKLLYERLLVKYEQALVMIGSLEAQNIAPGSNNNEKINQLEKDLAKQEELIMGLYQDLRLFKSTDNEFQY